MATYTQCALAIMLVNAQVACCKYLLTAGQFDQVANFWPRVQKYRKANNRELIFLSITVKFFQVRQ